jgi:hypothetical protein
VEAEIRYSWCGEESGYLPLDRLLRVGLPPAPGGQARLDAPKTTTFWRPGDPDGAVLDDSYVLSFALRRLTLGERPRVASGYGSRIANTSSLTGGRAQRIRQAGELGIRTGHPLRR